MHPSNQEDIQIVNLWGHPEVVSCMTNSKQGWMLTWEEGGSTVCPDTKACIDNKYHD